MNWQVCYVRHDLISSLPSFSSSTSSPPSSSSAALDEDVLSCVCVGYALTGRRNRVKFDITAYDSSPFPRLRARYLKTALRVR